MVNIVRNRIRILLTLAIAFSMAAQGKSDDYLKDQPSFLKSCNLQNLNADDKCIAKGLENIFTSWKDGIPGLKSVGSIDPFKIKKIHLEQTEGNIDFKADFKNIVLNGLSSTKIERVSVSNQYNFKILFKVAKVHMKADYRLKGRILVLNLDGTGPMQAETSGMEVIAQVKTKLVERSGQKFFEVQQTKCSIGNISGFRTRFDNLFGGNRDLENSANELFNTSWRELFQVMRPALEETFNSVVYDRFKKILNYVPARYFFADVQ